MAWTTPMTWASGDILTAADMNDQVSGNLDYIANDALTKLLVASGSYSLNLTVTNTETALTSLFWSDPGFPTTSYAYIAYGWFIANTVASGGTPSDLQLYIRDNGTSGTRIGRVLSRSTGNNSRQSLGCVSSPTTVASGSRSAYYSGEGATGTDTFDVNYSGLATYLGAVLAPI